MSGLLSAAALDRAAIEELITSAETYRAGGGRRHPDAVVALMFFEESLRTRVGFEVAAARLGARGVAVYSVKHSPAMEVSETLDDAILSVGDWVDAICLRHGDAAVFSRLAGLVDTPVVNCGSGRDEHPTQALVDLLAIKRALGRIDGFSIGLVGDLAAMRVAHSLAVVLARFDAIRVRAMSPAGLGLPEDCLSALRDAGHEIVQLDHLDAGGLDVLYVAGLPADSDIGRLSREEQGRFQVSAEVVVGLGDGGVVLCPLPRVDEIAADVDDLPAARYFDQSREALWVRMAVLDRVLTQA